MSEHDATKNWRDMADQEFLAMIHDAGLKDAALGALLAALTDDQTEVVDALAGAQVVLRDMSGLALDPARVDRSQGLEASK